MVLADAHDFVREGLKRVIHTQDDMEVVGEANNGADAVRLVATLRPSILLVDIVMPGMTGMDVTRAVRASFADAQVIGVTRHRDPQFVTEMFAAGAAGYVLKQSPSDELLRAIRAVAAGGDFVDAALPQKDSGQPGVADVDATTAEAVHVTLDDL